MINLNSYLFMNLNFRKKYIRTNIDSQVTWHCEIMKHIEKTNVLLGITIYFVSSFFFSLQILAIKYSF